NIDEAIGDRLVNGGINYGNFNFTDEKKINLGFSSIKIGEMIFHKKSYSLFNDEQFAGDGFGFPYEGMVIPIDDRMDPVSRTKVPSFSMNYLSDNGNSREMVVTPVDLMKVGDDGQDKMEVRYLSE